MSLEVGSVIEGKITGITKFGAFVELAEGKTGLVHISEVADAYVHDIKDYFQENEVIKVKIINMSEGKIGLSIRQVNGSPPARSNGRQASGPPRRRSRRSFEDKLNRFMKESDERQQVLRRSRDAKRGGRGTKTS
jgi:S1 RNA binding domain protein